MKMLPLMWSGVVLDPSGYGEASRGYLKALSERYSTMPVKVVPKYFHRGDSVPLNESYETIERLHATPLDKTQPYMFLQHLTPEQYLLGAGKCKYHIGMTTFETNTIPSMWQIPLRAMDEVFTFSRWAKDVFLDVGIRRPITVINHGVDVERFSPAAGSMAKLDSVTAGRFTFGANFDWTERKNPGALIRAFWMAFKPSDDVVLVLKTYNQFAGNKQSEFFSSYLSQIKQEMGLQKTPPVVLLTEMLSSADIPRFYNSLDCYALPSRGEGWGLTYSEAMASGIPTIAVNWSGHTEFMNGSNSLLVKDYKLRPIRPDECPNQPYYAGHLWADVSVEAFAQAMRSVYEKSDDFARVGSVAREHMVKWYTWQECAAKLFKRIEEINGQIG